MLANKFNEAVEVILELSEKVNRLETHTFSEIKKQNNKKQYSFLNFKLLAFTFIILFLVWGFMSIPIDIRMIKTILTDIFSVI